MRFSADHDFAAPCAPVAAVLTDPDFYTGLQLPDVAVPDLLAHDVDGTMVTIRLRYAYAGQLDPIARKILSGRELAWIQTVAIDLTSFTGTLGITGDGDDRLQGHATVQLTETHTTTGTTTGTTTRRSIAGEFRIRVPIVGGQAEKRIVPGLVARLAVEAAAVSAALDRG